MSSAFSNDIQNALDRIYKLEKKITIIIIQNEDLRQRYQQVIFKVKILKDKVSKKNIFDKSSLNSLNVLY